MPLPPAIQAQLDQSDAIQAQMHALANPGEESATPKADDTPAPTQAQDAVAPPPAQAPADNRGADVWEQKYRVLQGKYDAEVPRLHSELRELRNTVQQLNQVVANVTTQQAQKPTEAPKPLVTQKDVETFGGDLVDLIGRKADEIASARVAALKAEVQALQDKLGQTAQRQDVSDSDRFYSALRTAVPDYEEVNKDPRWLQWLGTNDPLTGFTRQNYLDRAAKGLDAARTAAIFNAFKASLGAQAPTPASQVDQAQQELQAQVAPSKSSAGSPKPAATAQTKVWKSRDIDAFYKRVRLKEINDADAARIESEINQAMAEGRVQL